MGMDELTSGLKKLRLSLIPLLLSQVALILMEAQGSLVDYGLGLPSMLSSAALATLSYALAMRGLKDLCSTLGGVFCILKRLVKYLLPATIFFAILGFSYTYEDLQSLTPGVDALLGRPILLLMAILFASLGILVAYSLLRLGSSMGSRVVKLGSILLIPPPFIVIAGYPTFGSSMAALGSLILMLSLTKLIKSGIEVVEEEQVELPEEEKEAPPRPRVLERELPPTRGRLDMERLERIPPKPKEVRAKLLGPSGLAIELELGVRMFGRRDFLGYVPEEDLDYISRRHFEIKGTREGFFIRDLGSLNGTWVNGNKLGRGEYVKLTNGSVIDVAEVVRLRFSLEAEDLGVPEI
ncbi:MAG: FHA domain-containing protein [Candidatus Korarchaeum sp.]